MAAAAMLPNTVAWLLALVSQDGEARVRALSSGAPEDPQALIAAVFRHGTGAIALRRADRFPALRPLLPPLRNAQAHNVIWAFASVSHLAAIASAFGHAGISWCALKGVPLALCRYGNIAARKVGDIDILVSPSQMVAADKALRDKGWRPLDAEQPAPSPFWHERRYAEPAGMTLELHHRLHPNPRLLALPTATLLDHCAELDIGGIRIPVLDPVTELLYLSTHGSRHGWYRLLWVCDVAAIVAQETPVFLDAAYREGKRLGLLHPLAQALLLAETLLGVSAPTWAQRLGQSSARQQRLLAFAEETLWCPRDASSNPVQRSRSSLRNALDQRLGLRFWLWELALRAQHEWRQRRQASL